MIKGQKPFFRQSHNIWLLRIKLLDKDQTQNKSKNKSSAPASLQCSSHNSIKSNDDDASLQTAWVQSHSTSLISRNHRECTTKPTLTKIILRPALKLSVTFFLVVKIYGVLWIARAVFSSRGWPICFPVPTKISAV